MLDLALAPCGPRDDPFEIQAQLIGEGDVWSTRYFRVDEEVQVGQEREADRMRIAYYLTDWFIVYVRGPTECRFDAGAEIELRMLGADEVAPLPNP